MAHVAAQRRARAGSFGGRQCADIRAVVRGLFFRRWRIGLSRR
ncbi:hypothetical protein [Lysobacter gummosus]